jgi:FkbM family methyltransferase
VAFAVGAGLPVARPGAWSGALRTWVIEAPVGTVRYRLCLAVLLGRRAPTRLARVHLTVVAFLAPMRDRVPWLRDRPHRVRLREPHHDVSWTVGPASDFDVLNEVLVVGEYDGLGLAAPRVVVDLGSHIGVSILRLRTLYPNAQIYGFEPDPATFSRLTRNVAQLVDVTVLPWAIGDLDGRVAFFPRRQSWLSSASPDRSDGPGLTVESVTLDRALERLGLSEIDLIKLDVEGAEASILRGFRGLPRVRTIVGELHGQTACDEVSGLLADFEIEAHGHPDHRHFRARR